MSLSLCLLAASVLPLFPLGWVFNRLVASLPAGIAQGLAALILPQLGIALLGLVPPSSTWPVSWRYGAMAWATGSALLYALRALSARDLGIWTRLMLSSGLGVVWLGWCAGAPAAVLRAVAVGWSLPGAVALFLAGVLVRRVGGAYIGLQGGLATVMPRMTASLVLAALALTATPVFPAFFALWRGLGSIPLAFVPFWLPLIFLWGWAAGRLFQDLLFGDYRGERVADIGRPSAALIGLVLLAAVVLGFHRGGVTL